MITLTNEIEFLEKELETINDRKKKIHLVSDQVGGWSNRVVSKLNSQLLGTDNPVSKKQTLISLFGNITDIVCD